MQEWQKNGITFLSNYENTNRKHYIDKMALGILVISGLSLGWVAYADHLNRHEWEQLKSQLELVQTQNKLILKTQDAKHFKFIKKLVVA